MGLFFVDESGLFKFLMIEYSVGLAVVILS